MAKRLFYYLYIHTSAVLRTIAVCLHGQLGVEHTATLHPVDNPS